MKKKKQDIKKKNVWQIIKENWFLVTSFLILLLTIGFVVSNKSKNEELFIFGYKPYVITSESMQPYLNKNAIIIIKKTPYDKVKVNDVISFKADGFNVNVCHRVVAITDEGFVTKGDKVNIIDGELVTKDNYVGKLVFKTNLWASYLGVVQRMGFVVALILPLIAIIILIIGLKLFLSNNDDEVEPLIETKKKEIKEVSKKIPEEKTLKKATKSKPNNESKKEIKLASEKKISKASKSVKETKTIKKEPTSKSKKTQGKRKN